VLNLNRKDHWNFLSLYTVHQTAAVCSDTHTHTSAVCTDQLTGGLSLGSTFVCCFITRASCVRVNFVYFLLTGFSNTIDC